VFLSYRDRKKTLLTIAKDATFLNDVGFSDYVLQVAVCGFDESKLSAVKVCVFLLIVVVLYSILYVFCVRHGSVKLKPMAIKASSCRHWKMSSILCVSHICKGARRIRHTHNSFTITQRGMWLNFRNRYCVVLIVFYQTCVYFS
jgi:hypothetical protein